MAVTFVQVWPTASAGAMASSDATKRAMFQIAGVLEIQGQEAFLTVDGTDATDPLIESTSTNCPLIMPITEDAQDGSALTQAGGFGPVMDPADSVGRDLFMHRYQFGTTRWKVTMYLAGLGSDGLYDGSGAGRGFSALVAGLGNT